MNMPYHIAAVLVFLTSGPLSSLRGASSIPDHYAPVLKRNIFRQSFTKPPPPFKPAASVTAAPPPKPCYMLTGVIKYEYSFAAIFENKVAGNVQFVEAGESVDDSKVVTITATSVTIERQGEQRVIELGQTLSGETPSTVTYQPSPSSTTSSVSTPPTASVAPSPSPIKTLSGSLKERLEAMRRRRQQQEQKLGKSPASSSK